MMKHPLLKDAEERMKKALSVMHSEFATVRTGRPSPALLEHIKVDYYGSPTPIPYLATITVPEPHLMVIQPFDKSIINQIEKAIQSSDLGITPSNDGNVIRLPFPPLTEERRLELVKVVKHMAEEAKIAVRNIRREVNEEFKKMKNNGEISEDEYHYYLDEVQKLTDRYIEEIEKDLKIKEDEIMKV